MSFAVSPQPITFPIRATMTNAMENHRRSSVKPSNEIFSPILAKNTGPNSM